MNDLPWVTLGLLDGAEGHRKGRRGGHGCCVLLIVTVVLLIVVGFIVRSSV